MSTYTFHTTENTDGERKALLQGVKDAYGFVPNLFGYMAEAPTTLKAYLELNKLIGEGSIPAPQAQIALLAVSLENRCEFCSVAHQAMSKKFASNPQSVEALVNGNTIEDPKDSALAEMAQEIVRTKGWVAQEKMDRFYASGFAPQQYFELVLIVTIKTLSNYINHQTTPHANQELLDVIG